MTREQARFLGPWMTRWGNGENVEFFQNGGWKSMDFTMYKEFRIKPEPEPSFRPWQPEEVPVGAMIRYKGGGRSTIILSTGQNGNIWDGSHPLSGHNNYTPLHALLTAEHSFDHGKTWLPCGVLE